MIKIGFYVSVFIVIVFLLRKKKPQPSKLNLEAYKDTKNKLGAIRKVRAEVVEDERGRAHSNIFSYSGKKHNAWRVLGVPAGADYKRVQRAFSEKAKADPANKALYEKAYLCLRKTF